MKSGKICLDEPNIGAWEKARVFDAMASGYVSTFGPFVPAFEEKLARFLRV